MMWKIKETTTTTHKQSGDWTNFLGLLGSLELECPVLILSLSSK